MFMRSLAVFAAGVVGEAVELHAVPFRDGSCWNTVASVVQTVRDIKGLSTDTALTANKPLKEEACRSFDATDRRVMALALMQCRLLEREGVDSTLSASHLVGGTAEGGCFDVATLRGKAVKNVDGALMDCIRKMDNYSYHLYIEHMNHVEAICFHVHSLLWQQHAEALITDLVSSAADVGAQLARSSEQFSDLSKRQTQALELQERILENGQTLQHIVQSGHSRVQNAFEHMRSQVEQEHEKVLALFSDIFQGVSRLTSFQQYLKVKMLDVESVAIFCFLLFMTHHFTSTVKTQSARVPMIIVWTTMLATEMLLQRQHPNEDPRRHQWLGSLRCVCMGLSLLIWIRCYVRYEDPYARVLHEVQSQVTGLERKLDCYLLKPSRASLDGVASSIVRRKDR